MRAAGAHKRFSVVAHRPRWPAMIQAEGQCSPAPGPPGAVATTLNPLCGHSFPGSCTKPVGYGSYVGDADDAPRLRQSFDQRTPVRGEKHRDVPRDDLLHQERFIAGLLIADANGLQLCVINAQQRRSLDESVLTRGTSEQLGADAFEEVQLGLQDQ